MKHRLFCLAALLAGMSAGAAGHPDPHPIAFDRLPQAAQAFVEDFYAPSEVAAIRADGDSRYRTYRIRFTNGDEAFFAADGIWTLVESATALPLKFISEPIATYVNDRYPGRTVQAVIRDGAGYEVQLSDQTILLFDARQQHVGTKSRKSDRLRTDPPRLRR